MLVLGRRVNETIKIGDDVTITLVAIRSLYDVRIGIDAPKHIKIVRGELPVHKGDLTLPPEGG